VTKDFSGTVLGLSYINGASQRLVPNPLGKDLGKDRILFSITRTF
jgi:hypothetical protein